MNLVEMKCKNCGAQLDIDNEAKEASCRFCGMTFKIDGVLNAVQNNEISNIDHVVIGNELQPGGNKRISDLRFKTRLKAIALATFLLLSGNEAIKALDSKKVDNTNDNKNSIEINVDLTPEEKIEADRQIEAIKALESKKEDIIDVNINVDLTPEEKIEADRQIKAIEKAEEEIHLAMKKGKDKEEIEKIIETYKIDMEPNNYETIDNTVEELNHSVKK